VVLAVSSSRAEGAGKASSSAREASPPSEGERRARETRPSTTGSGSQGIKNLPVNETRGGPAKGKTKKSSFFNTHYYHTKRILRCFQPSDTPGICFVSLGSSRMPRRPVLGVPEPICCQETQN